MKFTVKMLIMLISVSFACQYAVAQSQQPKVDKHPDIKPGDRFAYVNGVFLLKCNRWEVKESDKSGHIVSKCGENTMYVASDTGNPIMAVNDKGETVARFSPYFPALSFPLYVGKKWSGKYDGQQGRLRWTGDVSCESTAFEEVQVAAGKFGAFRIECANKWDSGIVFINGTKKSTSWYAPEAKLIVKSINDDSDWNYELSGTGWQ